ncbi:uncharacterized protein LOC117105292 isoform X2 [Anneissia japonica]|uniref:uncharacterized protein LOC117105292 isoform X2 n=1 Tax=Anneissia japonica TaxID=1529436 RepID=UPI0014255DAB|nr:uncharacterized protein LOC117105292 isoform X2 [Anneissia japonica]
MGCGGSKSQTQQVIPSQVSKSNVLNIQGYRQGSSKSTGNKRKESRNDERSAHSRRSKENHLDVKETPIQTSELEPEDKKVIRSQDVDKGKESKDVTPEGSAEPCTEKTGSTNAGEDEVTPVQVFNDETPNKDINNNLFQESQPEQEKPLSKPGDNEELKEVTQNEDTTKDTDSQNCLHDVETYQASVKDEAPDDANSEVSSVTATAIGGVVEIIADVEIATTASNLMDEITEDTSEEMKSSELNVDVFPVQIIHIQDQGIHEETSTQNEKPVKMKDNVLQAQRGSKEALQIEHHEEEMNPVDQVDLESFNALTSTVPDDSNEAELLTVTGVASSPKISGEIPIQVNGDLGEAPPTFIDVSTEEAPSQEPRDTDDQIKFNQAIRAFCRLVDPDALKAIATPKITELCLERALPCSIDIFTHILANIGKLKVLDLSGNHIGPQSFRAIVLALLNNKTLKSLNLSNNKTDTQCSECLGMMLAKNDTLEELDLSSNQLGRDFFSRSVGPAMALNSTLKVLRCASCGFADLSLLIDSLSTNSSLVELDISHNHMVDGTEFGEKLAVMISNSLSISILNVKATNISAEGMQEVQKSLEVNTALTKLNIGGNQMFHCCALLHFLITSIHHAGLKDLSLEDTTYKNVDNVFDDVTTNQVGKSNLMNLNLSNCGLVDFMVQTLVGSMPGCLSGLKLLNVANNSELTSERIKGFARLTSDVRKCQISTSNLVQLAFFLNKPDGISSLCLDGQKLSGSDVLQVILSCGQDSSLESLSLIGCALNDDDIAPITLALRAGLGLKSLKLAANRITDRSIGEFVESCVSQEICTIEYVNIANNKISCEGASHISRLLSSCSALHTLLVSNNSIGADGLRAIVGSVKPDSSLRLLDLKGQANPIDEEDMEEILTVLTQALGYTLEKNEYGLVSMATNSLVTVHQDLTVLLTNLGGLTGEMGRAIESSIVRTDYSKVYWPHLGLEEMLVLGSILKGHSPSTSEKVSLTAKEWNLIIGEGKDPCVPSWLQVDSHRDCAVYLAGLPASVSANRIEGDLDGEADCVITEVCIMKDPILKKPNGLCWVLMSDADSVDKAVKLYESGEARLFNQPYMISRLNVAIVDGDTAAIGDKAQEEMERRSKQMERRSKQRDAEDQEHRALLETSFAASKARHEYAAANPAYADGRIW